MTRKEKRIEVIKDVLKQLRYLKISRGNYVMGDCELKGGDNLKEKFSELKKCHVCAKGALFLGHVDKYNKLSLSDINDSYEDDEKVYDIFLEEEEVVKPLLSYFSRQQLDMIECAFEQADINDLSDTKPNIAFKCKEFGKKYSDNKKRLRAILKNCLENDGLFKP